MYQIAGTGNYASIKVETGETTAATSLPNYDIVTVSGSTFVAGTGTLAGIDAAKTTVTVNAGGMASLDELWIATPTAGTITVKYISVTYTTGIATFTTNQTITIVAGSSAVDPVASTAWVNNAATTGATADATVVPQSKSVTNVVVANVELTMKTLLGTPYKGTDFSASISGPGLIANDNDGTPSAIGVSKVAALTFDPATGKTWITVAADGTAGTATLSILVGTTVWKTKTFVFHDVASKYKVDSTTPATVVSLLGVGKTQAWNLSTTDASGNAVSAAPTIYAVSSDTSILTVSVVGDVVTATGVKPGTATFTVCDTASCVSPAITLGPVTVNVSDVLATSATFTLDKASYVVGEAFTLTINAKDSTGRGLADGAYGSMATLTTNVQVSAGTDGVGYPINFTATPLTVTFVNGVATYKGYMPVGVGDVKFTLTLNATGGTTTGVATSAAGAVLSAAATVTSAAIDAANAAADAAAEAIDAANAATDAANLASEAADAATVAAEEARDAADAATAAIEELAQQVASLMAALKAQIATLANTVAKIAKKVKA